VPSAVVPGLTSPKVPGVGAILGGISHAYVMREGGSTYLIDTGLPGNAHRIERAFYKAGVPLSALGNILLTHQHPDHMGGAAYLRWRTHARVACHEMDTPAVEGRGPRLSPLPVRLLFHPHPVQVDRVLKDGDTVGPFTVVHTPGHTLGSVSYFHAERKILFVGDAAVVQRRTGLGLALGFSNFDPDTGIDSLEKLSQLGAESLFSGHGPPITRGAAAALKEAHKRLAGIKIPKHWTLVGPEGMPETHPRL
jgi:glyoxylase-like metal-dependent hydrolase (beta-lactamase superfamily II)